ncbi:MAG: GntR family transcriptional regulator [Wenzhouxiangella sp.]
MLFELKPGDSVPMYRQLVAQVQRLIASGQLRAGDSLPSVRAVAEHYTVNPMTVSRAYALLEEQGWLIRRQGRPMEVAQRAAQDAVARLATLQPLLDQVVREGRQLGLQPEAVIERLAQAFKDAES